MLYATQGARLTFSDDAPQHDESLTKERDRDARTRGSGTHHPSPGAMRHPLPKEEGKQRQEGTRTRPPSCDHSIRRIQTAVSWNTAPPFGQPGSALVSELMPMPFSK